MKPILWILCCLLIGWIIADIFIEPLIVQSTSTPAQILRFQPVCEDSDPELVRMAQAELCRHGIDVKIDGECGKQTALGMCELLVKIQNGYEVRTIYEKRLSE